MEQHADRELTTPVLDGDPPVATYQRAFSFRSDCYIEQAIVLLRLMKRFATALTLIGFGLLAAAVGAYLLFVKAPAEVAHTIAQGIKETFHFTPQVRINETVVIEQTSPIAELATVARDVLVDYDWSHRWLGSTKTLRLRGVFTAKAGFDLQQPFRITITDAPLEVRAELPPPKLLSVQMDSFSILEDESGWWNRISDEDREQAIGALQHSAREKVLRTGLLDSARATIERRIHELARRSNAAAIVTSPWRER